MMKYEFDFQMLHKGSVRPSDDGTVVHVATDDKGFAIVPAVGDYVDVVETTDTKGRAEVRGRVKSRLFRFYGEDACYVNIVVEEVEAGVWGSLIKE